ncbi:putative transcriptional regulatory protein CTL0717 [Crassostrea virginica]
MEMIQRALPSLLQRCVRSLRTNTCHPHRQCLLQQCELFPVSVRHLTGGDILLERTFIKTLPSIQWQSHRCMAGHSKFSNIKHRKEAQDHKKSSQMATYVRLAREAVKSGGSTDPKMNAKLAQVMESAKKSSLSPDTIKKLIERMKNKQMKEFMIEILGPGNSIFLVVVDAINMEHARTDVRAAMKRLPGKISMSPVSLHFFKHEGIVYVTPDPSHPDLEEVAIECEAEDVTMETNEEGQEMVKFTCDPTVLQEVKTKLEGRGLAVETYMENFDPLVLATPTEAEQEEIDSITERLENIENFVRLYTNLAS